MNSKDLSVRSSWRRLLVDSAQTQCAAHSLRLRARRQTDFNRAFVSAKTQTLKAALAGGLTQAVWEVKDNADVLDSLLISPDYSVVGQRLRELSRTAEPFDVPPD